MIRDDGWARYSIWEHSAQVRDLYRRRCRREAEEMTAHAQAAELLAPHVQPGDTLLDAGCGSGYFWHSLRSRGIEVEYVGIDGSETLIGIGREEMPAHGMAPEQLRVVRLEDLAGEADHVVCINVLSNLDNYHRPLERLLHVARKTLVLRESCKDEAEYKYVRDPYLDEGADLKVHVNAYPTEELMEFVRDHGFDVRYVEDRRTQGEPEMVIDHPHHWKFFVAESRR